MGLVWADTGAAAMAVMASNTNNERICNAASMTSAHTLPGGFAKGNEQQGDDGNYFSCPQTAAAH